MFLQKDDSNDDVGAHVTEPHSDGTDHAQSTPEVEFAAPPAPPEKPKIPPAFDYITENIFLCERFVCKLDLLSLT